MILNQGIMRFMQKRIGKNVVLAGKSTEYLDSFLDEYFYEMKKMEKRQLQSDIPRLLECMHKGHQKNKYWRDTIRHYDQKKTSFFVTSVLARKKVSVPIR